ncbi:MAG TPA: peroxiredoxin [Streptomyces sp.]|nr:peroxiredoxin [Streptomyces sp.]
MGREHSYEVTVSWTGNTGTGTDGYRTYDRAHDIATQDKPVIRGSADPAFAGDPDRWNPEELLVASLSQCHMLTYLALCALSGVVVTGYEDTARGRMQEAAGSGRFSEVVLEPVVTLADAGMAEKAAALHEQAHKKCFVANSVNFPVRHEAEIRVQASGTT